MKKGNPFTIESLFKKVYPEPNSGCWLWGGKLEKNGYGKSLLVKEKLHNAHRISYFLHFGDFDRKLSVLHKCDIPSCVNPNHLYLGTQQQNIIDRDTRKRGKWQKGEKSGRAIISEEIAKQIKIFLRNGVKQKEIAIIYNIGEPLISAISTGRSWKHINI